jgi:YD repeat-containing protein
VSASSRGAGNSLWFASWGYTTPAGDFSTLSYSSNVYTRTLKDGTLQKFNSSGYQTSLVDRNSNIVTFSYDGSNNLSTITDPNNLVTTFGYTSGKVSTITDPANRITTLSYRLPMHLMHCAG